LIFIFFVSLLGDERVGDVAAVFEDTDKEVVDVCVLVTGASNF
jgi:hypothetical protein